MFIITFVSTQIELEEKFALIPELHIDCVQKAAVELFPDIFMKQRFKYINNEMDGKIFVKKVKGKDFIQTVYIRIFKPIVIE